MTNGNKAAQQRARKAKEAGKGPSSQLKSNAAAKNIKCKVCFQDWQSTTKRPALEQHATDRHSKTYEECFDS